MRLTLRTLLAYLDDTLEPQEAEVLRQKLESSGFATQLVHRIRASLADQSLSAPAPDSVHPIEDPNMMSNYLDSTLSPEQIAEIEKACLESPPHLAEAAACHQILTMVLGRPAEASDQLRDRIFSMVDLGGRIIEHESASIAGQIGIGTPSPIAGEIGPRYSGIDLTGPSEDSSQPTGSASDNVASDLAGRAVESTDGIDVPSEVASTDPIVHSDEQPQVVRPVGVDDSGVFQAATKLREQSHQFAETGTALDDSGPLPEVGPLAGSRPLRQLERSDLYEGDVRPSRITPWLVSLALVGVLLFAIVQIFAPLVGPKVAQDSDQEKVSDTYPDLPVGEQAEADPDVDQAEESTPPVDNTSAAVAVEKEKDADVEVLPLPETGEPIEEPISAADLTATEPTEPTEQTGGKMATDLIPPASSDATDDKDQPTDVADESPTPAPGAGDMADQKVASLLRDTTTEKVDNKVKEPDAQSSVMEAGASSDSPDAAVSDAAVAKLVSSEALVARRDGDKDWELMAADTSAALDTTVVCVPEYRAEFAMSGNPELTVTLVGPSQIRWIQGQQSINLQVGYGKGIFKLVDPGNAVNFVIGDLEIVAKTESSGAILAYDVTFYRELGADPMVPENHITRVELSSVLGSFAISGLKDAIELENGSRFTYDSAQSDKGQNEVTKPTRLASWIDPEIETGSLESDAASDLLELVRTDGAGSLLLSLRVALDFRRDEVVALAGKSMLALGDASSYFGVDGLFSKPKQRLYWSAHLDAVREMIDRSVQDAASVRTAISGQDAVMDNADGDTLFRLLTGYAQDQLKTGGDAELVSDLESGSISVRVLASEHLRDISGTTLFFKPEEEVVSSREKVIDKWKVRLRKDSIRYAEAE